MSTRMRYLVLLLSILLIGIGACQPVKKKTPPTPGSFIAYYVTGSPGTGFRSVTPHSTQPAGGGTSSQALLPDGSVQLEVVGAADPTLPVKNGFLIVPIRLGDIESIVVQLAPGSHHTAGIDLWFDKDGDGDFLQWNAAGNFTGFGGDVWAVDKDISSATLNVSNSTLFQLVAGSDQDRTLAQLKAGAENGIGAGTRLVIFVYLGVFPQTPDPTNANATVSSVRLNGTELLVP